jgi:hypothetical protein
MIEESHAETHTRAGIAVGSGRRALVTRTGRPESAEAARARTLDVARDAGTPR